MCKKVVGVIGGHSCSREIEELAENLGKELAKVNDYLVCGGLEGVMKAVCRGFKNGGGTAIGIIPGYDKIDANPYVDIVIPTGMGLARNVLVVKTSDVVIALPGEYGTLSEIAYCLQFDIPVISLKSWDIKGVIKVETIDEAIIKVKQFLEGVRNESNFDVRGQNNFFWRGKK
ncbi:MAG: TIGR00725 family protein [Candidatus Omnitrophica bacterium]|nr:TIGR00725 family protein [Candidatus Omnitrophota bacterium]MCM8826530.1 TIGR00725 family protein [Candidatus Omnitrophota bacterium]